MTTPKIVMPELAVGQAGKEITHNDALAILDQLVQARVVDKDLATPPGSPANGAAYIVASSPTGAWVGHTNHIAYWLTAVGVWQFLIPAAGWEVWVTDESLRYTFGGSTWAQSLNLTSALNEAPIVTIASAATVNVGAAAANTISISGTTTITAFDTIASGALRRLHFQGALTLTHNATSLILPTAANITTAAGDVAEFVSLGSGNWRCTGYERANGDPVTFAYDRENIVGTVSQSAGVPTGGIIEQGSNANGRYVRYADGTQICYQTTASQSVSVTTAVGQLFYTAPALERFTFPIAFTAMPVVSYSVASASGLNWATQANAATATQSPNFYVLGAVSVTTSVTFDIVSIGRWY